MATNTWCQGGSFIYWSDGVFANHSIAGTDDTVEAGAEARDYSNGMIYFFDHSFENGTWVPQGHADFTEFFVDRHKNNFEVNAGYLDVSPNYNPIDGYTPNSDIRGPQFETDFQGRTPAIKNYSALLHRSIVSSTGPARSIRRTRSSSSTQRSPISSRSTA